MTRSFFLRISALMLLLGLWAAPSSAQINLDMCWSICSSSSPCDQVCFDDGDGIFFSTCGEYGVCESSTPPCQDPKRVTTRVDTIPTGSVVTGSWCHFDHWYPGDPFAWDRYYDYTSYSYRKETIRVTEFCNGTVTEQLVSTSTYSVTCARRTWAACFSAWGPPPLICA